MISATFVPLAIAAHESRRQDAEGEFLKTIAESQPYGQRYGHVQGLIVADVAGRAYLYVDTDAGYQDPELADKLRMAADMVQPAEPVHLDDGPSDQRLRPEMPPGTQVVRVLTKNIDDPDQRSRMGGEDLGYENLWILPDEAQQLARDRVPESLKQRIATYHLLNSYTGESQLHHVGKGPDYVEGQAGVREFELTLDDGVLSGSVHIFISPTHHYRASLLGFVEAKDGQLTRFDLIARGPWVRKFFADSPLERTTQVAAFRLATEEQMKHDGSYRIPPGFHVFPMNDYLRQPNP